MLVVAATEEEEVRLVHDDGGWLGGWDGDEGEK